MSALAACAPANRVLGPEQWDILLELPGESITAFTASADGSLFAATPSALYRATASETPTFAIVAQHSQTPVDLLALSADRVYARVMSPWAVWEWRGSGEWKDTAFPTPAGGWLWAMWGVPGGDLYVVGDGATIARHTDSGWVREANPLDRYAAAQTAPEAYYGRIVAIGGDGQAVYAASDYRVLEKRGSAGWQEASEAHQSCPIAAIAADGSDVYLAGGEHTCLVRVHDHTVERRDHIHASLGAEIVDGRQQPDGSALFWTYRGRFLSISRGRARQIAVTRFNAIGGAAVVHGQLYFAGTFQGDGVVARIPFGR